MKSLNAAPGEPGHYPYQKEQGGGLFAAREPVHRPITVDEFALADAGNDRHDGHEPEEERRKRSIDAVSLFADTVCAFLRALRANGMPLPQAMTIVNTYVAEVVRAATSARAEGNVESAR